MNGRRFATLTLCAGLVVVLGVAGASFATPLRDLRLQDGDIVFQRSRSEQSRAVALATGSEWTHMGLVWLKDGSPWVLEAVQPVRLTRLSAWAARGVDGRFVVKRLRDADQWLTPAAVGRLRALGKSWIGRDYDPLFRWDDDRLYCSELVYKLFDRAVGVQVGELRRAKDFNFSSPEVRQLLARRFGRSGTELNPEEIVVSPQQIFEDPKLVTVFER